MAAKRASLIGRGPTFGDVHVAMDYFGLRRDVAGVRVTTTEPFRGLAHSYAAQRRFVTPLPATTSSPAQTLPRHFTSSSTKGPHHEL